MLSILRWQHYQRGSQPIGTGTTASRSAVSPYQPWICYRRWVWRDLQPVTYNPQLATFQAFQILQIPA
jgi:hypothetical protein